MAEKELTPQQGSGCDVNAFGSAFLSQRNKQSQKISDATGMTLVHNVKDKDGNILVSREFVVGGYAHIVRGLKPGEEIDESKVDVDTLTCGKIQGFWTCIDGQDTEALGAEILVSPHKMRLPLRILIPTDSPQRREDPVTGEQT